MAKLKNVRPMAGSHSEDVIDLTLLETLDTAFVDAVAPVVATAELDEIVIDIDELERQAAGEAIDAALRAVEPATYRAKRVLDIAVLAAAAVPSVLVGTFAAIAIKATSPGPVFFCQKRMGLAGEEFVCFKFRTMLDGKNPLVPDASRITGIGKWLRRFSLDELPQLWNVARGEMSIVGPRPMLRHQAEQCSPAQMRRLAVRPGLTGWAQINGRNAISWATRIELDLAYVERQSARFDTRIILGTAKALLSGDGVEGHDAADPFAAEAAQQHA